MLRTKLRWTDRQINGRMDGQSSNYMLSSWGAQKINLQFKITYLITPESQKQFSTNSCHSQNRKKISNHLNQGKKTKQLILLYIKDAKTIKLFERWCIQNYSKYYDLLLKNDFLNMKYKTHSTENKPFLHIATTSFWKTICGISVFQSDLVRICLLP